MDITRIALLIELGQLYGQNLDSSMERTWIVLWIELSIEFGQNYSQNLDRTRLPNLIQNFSFIFLSLTQLNCFPALNHHFRKRETEAALETSGTARRARQDLLRRRDLNLFHGFHPRVLENHQLSLLPARKASAMGEVVRTVGPYRAFPRDECPSRVNDTSKCEEDCAFVSQILKAYHHHKLASVTRTNTLKLFLTLLNCHNILGKILMHYFSHSIGLHL